MIRWSVLERRLLPAYVWTTDPLTFWRERILLIICFLAAVLGPIALIPSLWLAYQERLWSVILLDSAAYITSVVIIIGRDWPLKGRTCGVCFILYALGACLLFILGPVGAGYIWLFGASVIISAIIGLEAAIWTLALNAVTLLSISIFIRYGVMQWTIQYDNALEKWLVMSANFLLLNAFVTLTTAMMLNGLSKALSTEQDFIHSLQESEERFRAISEFSHHAICIIDETARITWVNNKMLEISGYSREQVLGGGTFFDFLAPESSDFVTSNYLKFINGEVYQHHYHFNIIRADGANRLIEKYMTDYADKHGRKHLIISMLDVTDQKLAENAISDTGHGIMNKDIERIFDPFFTTRFTGRGLGLPVVMGMVKAHGGGVTVDSEPGQGSVFRVFLPVSTDEVTFQPDLPAMPEALQTVKSEEFSRIEGGGTVLVIEDEAQVRNMVKKMLTRLGYKVIEARDGAETVEIFQQHQHEIHIVLSDLTMPCMDGWMDGRRWLPCASFRRISR